MNGMYWTAEVHAGNHCSWPVGILGWLLAIHLFWWSPIKSSFSFIALFADCSGRVPFSEVFLLCSYYKAQKKKASLFVLWSYALTKATTFAMNRICCLENWNSTVGEWSFKRQLSVALFDFLGNQKVPCCYVPCSLLRIVSHHFRVNC